MAPVNISAPVADVNAHLHTPWSFSAFDSVTGALDMAAAEGVRVVGINDFYTTGGYDEWEAGCRARGLYPLFGIEMIGLDEEAQRAGIRVNDPANPGRTYISGKGLACPARLPEPYASQLAAVRAASDAQVRAMCGRLNEVLTATGSGIPPLDPDEITRTLTRGSLRERHLAKALRLVVWARAATDEQRRVTLENIFGGRPLKADPQDPAAVENEIRTNLLKAGGAAFVPETPEAFLPLDRIVKTIEAAGGISTYPFLADDASGAFTDFESDLPKAAAALKAKGIHSVEFITTRNSAAVLERYAGWLWDEGFVVTFGSEHNTPAMEPILLHTHDGAPLSDRLRELNYAGACVVAAHQEAYAQTGTLYDPALRDVYAARGDEFINRIINGNG